MGENKCAFDGCNALEFRATGYCLRHKKDLSDKRSPNITENPSKEIQNASKVEIEWYLFFIGIPFSLFGLINGLISGLGFAGFTVSLRWRKKTPKFTTVAIAGIFCSAVAILVLLFNDSNIIISLKIIKFYSILK